jgi:hypothetical protein
MGRGVETVEDVLRDERISQCRSFLCPRGSHGAAPACMEASAFVSWMQAMVKCEGRRKLRLWEVGVGEVK